MADIAQLHATCVSHGGKGVLLFGESGSGKSDLALRLIDEGAVLVGDDQVQVRRQNGALLASPSERIHGMIEARGIGILHLPHEKDAVVRLAVRLAGREEVERLPQPQFWSCLEVQVPLLSLHAFDISTAAKIRMYLQHKD
jgi:HPr kinase/phosphorylase